MCPTAQLLMVLPINNEDGKEFYIRKNGTIYSILQLLKNSRKNQQKSAFIKIAAQAFQAGDFLDIFLMFWGFLRLDFFKKKILIKRTHKFSVGEASSTSDLLHIISCHFPDKDRQKETIFLGIIGWKRPGQSFWILIWIYYFLRITLVECKKYLTLLLTTLNACFFQYCTISDLRKLDFIVLLIAQQIFFHIVPAWLINLINLSIMCNEINLRSLMESNYFSSSSPIYHKIIPNPVQQSRQSDPFPSSNMS